MGKDNSGSLVGKIAGGTLVALLTFGLVELALRFESVVPLEYPENTLRPDLRLSLEHHHNVLKVPPVQVASVGASCAAKGPEFKVLFLGDSWMESTEGIPRGVAEGLIARGPSNVCVRIVNGGATSFAPSLMLVKGERLIREHRPDFVVVNVDETDLMDEYLRYRPTTLRDAQGRIERVVPNVVDEVMVYERPVLNQQPLYTLRLVEQIYYERVLLPRLRRQFFGSEAFEGSYDRILAPQLSSDPRATHAKEIAYFRGVLREMLDRLSTALPPGRLLVTHHPHYPQLAEATGAPRYNTIVLNVLREELPRTGERPIGFYDASADVGALYGDRPAAFFTWPADPFSHLTAEGYQRYGRFIAGAIDAKLVGVPAQ